jgi:hypothetical protein
MRWRCTCLAWSAHAIGKITAALLERARNALPAAAGHEYVALLARYREYFEHNEFDSDHPWSSRFACRRKSAPASKIAFLGFSDSGPSWSSRFACRRESAPACKIAPNDFVERAAGNMGLVDRLPALRKSFLDALK